MKDSSLRKVGASIGLIFLAATLLITAGVYGLEAGRSCWLLFTYQPVSVTVEKAWIEVTDYRPHRSRNSPARATYRPRVRYHYLVAGSSYTSERVTPLDHSGPPDWAQHLVDTFPAGTVAQGYYNPIRPSESFLRPGFYPLQIGSILLFPVLAWLVLQPLKANWTARKAR